MPTSNQPPNVLMFIPHDLGDHVNCYGHKSVRSPNLDHLAETGVRFTHCFTTAPECTPSRAGLYTGLYTHQTGLMGLCHRGWEFTPEVKHLAEYLWDAGYETCLFGMNHETSASPVRLGYNRIMAQKCMRNCFDVSAEAADWVTRDAPHASKPWFACVGFQDTHRPWRPAKDFGPDEVEVPSYMPDAPAVRADLAELHQAVYDMDTAIGRVLDALPIHCVRTRTHKYVRSFAVTPEDAAGADPAMLAKHETGMWIRADDTDVQRSPTWQVIKHEGPFPPPPPEELYDLETDPREENNLITHPDYAPVLEDLRAKLRAMMQRTNSPLLHGHVSPELSRTRNQPV